MDATLLIILLLIVFGTLLALLQSRRRDKCLRDFADFHVTLAEKGGDLTWGTMDVLSTGMEIRYVAPVQARGGHLEKSFIFYKDQYGAMEGLFRFPEALSPEQQQRRAAIIAQTAHPGFWRRFRRKLRNWVNMLRDALLQVVGVALGMAKTKTPGAAVLSSQEQSLKALSSEIIGHAGNAFDPLLERHLFAQVVVEVTREGRTRSFCGWLKDYTSDFIEIVDAEASPGAALAPATYRPGDTHLSEVTIAVEKGRLVVVNGHGHMLYVRAVRAGGWARPLGVVVPMGYRADLTLPPGTDPATVEVDIGAARRVDMVVPRTHALVRHAAASAQPPPDVTAAAEAAAS